MELTTAEEALSIVDPVLASPRGVGLVRAVLDQARRRPLIDEATVEPTEEERQRLEARHRVGPLVGRRFPTPEAVERERALMNVQLQLSIVAREVCSALAEAGIESRVLKGLATSELDYERPSFRHTGDVDLLVRRSDLERATEVLLAAGLTAADQVAAAEGRLTDGHNLKGVVFHHATGIEVDVHYRLSRFAPPTDALMDHTTDLLFGLSALSAEGRLIHAAAHAVLTPNPGRRLSSVADIVAILDNTVADDGGAGGADFSWDRARGLAEELGLVPAVGVGLRAEALLMGRGHHPGLDWPRPGHLLAALTETTKVRPLVEHVLAVAALPEGITRRSYVAHRLAPSAGLVGERGGRLAYYRKLLQRGRRPSEQA